MSDDVRADAREQVPASIPVGVYCGYGSCDRPPQHTGDHRCRCGGLVDGRGDGCAWHTAPTRLQLIVLAERDAALATLQQVRELADEMLVQGFPLTTRGQIGVALAHILDGGAR
ncbi:hypothetical protein NWF34_09970 [Gordonia sp. GONU]|uniref:hypothetical protein n=1 Tax=Gordonia sp. GONU TaxID=2972949 RepID=UPI0021AC2553|nr:hypothetical protein [Gordonia sp. GONU]MCR8897274.1 hypothetical protein [Gordonia sp. GONU]